MCLDTYMTCLHTQGEAARAPGYYCRDAHDPRDGAATESMEAGMIGTTPRLMSLAHLTVLDTTPPELVTVAAAAGFRSIGIRLTATPSVGVPPYTEEILRDGPLLRETLRRLADTGVSVLDTEFLRFEPEHPVGVPEGFLEVSARLGAKNVLVMSAEPEEARTLQRFCELCDRAAGYGLN